MNNRIKEILGLLISLFLVLGASGDALALQVMLPHITKEADPNITERAKPEDIILTIYPPETHALRNISPSDTLGSISYESLSDEGDLSRLEEDMEAYSEAKRIEEEMIDEIKSKPLTRQRRKIKYDRPVNRTKAERIERIAKRREKRKADKKLAKEARYAKKESDYIFDPQNFMKGLLGERVGLGHAYLRPERPGLERTYLETDGFRLVRMFDWIDGIDSIDFIGVSGRVELIEEPFPLESLILHARQLGEIRFGRWDTREQYRSQILPIFTKSTALQTDITYGHLPKFTFVYDYREVYHQLQVLWGLKDQDTKTFEFRLEDSRKWYPIGYVTLIPGYKYQIWDSESARSGNNSSGNFHRDVYFLETLWAPSGTLEFYTKVDAQKDNYADIPWKSSPWHWGVTGEIRKKYLPWQLNLICGYSHSFDKYSPFENFLRSDKVYLDIGKEFTGRLTGSSRWEYIYLQSTEDDNTAPTFVTPNPYEVDAKVLNIKNQLQYQILKNVYLKGGFDTASGFSLDEFNNFGLHTEIEYYNAGYFRCNFGYRYTRYYRIGEELGTIYFKCFLFM